MDFEDIFNMDWISNEEVPNTEYSYNEPYLETPQEPIPTLDQIKHLIEIAKQQIALKEQETQTAIPSIIFAPPEESKSEESVKSEEGPSEEVTTLEAYAAADGIDLKKLSSKERRQLRNKLSARNFRVRRKGYITSLEEQVAEHKKTADDLRERLNTVEDENKTLRKEMDTLKRQLVQSPRPLSMPKNKDISLLGTNSIDSYRQQDHNCILVSNAVMPTWDYSSILKERALLQQLAGYYILFVVQLFDQPKANMQDLYDVLIQDSLINNSSMDSSFLWA